MKKTEVDIINDCRKLLGYPEITKTESGMIFYAMSHNDMIRLHFGIGMPFKSHFSINLTEDETKFLIRHLIFAIDKSIEDRCANVKIKEYPELRKKNPVKKEDKMYEEKLQK